MKNGGKIIWIFLAAYLLVLPGCRRELDYAYVDYANIGLELNWDKFGKLPPDATVLFYPRNGEKYSMFILPNAGGTVQLKEGGYSLIVLGQKPDEYDCVEFEGMDAYETIKVVVKPLDKQGDIPIHAMPEKVGVSSMDMFEVTREMVEQTKVRVRDGNKEPVSKLAFSPLCLTRASEIELFINNIYNVRSIEGYIGGFTGGVMLHTRGIDNNPVVHYFSKPQVEYLPGSLTNAKVVIPVMTFGPCNGVKSEAQDIVLFLKIILVDKEKTEITVSYEIGDRVENALQTGERVMIGDENDPDNKPVEIPDVKPEDNPGGAFKPDVDDWGDEEDVEIDFSKKDRCNNDYKLKNQKK